MHDTIAEGKVARAALLAALLLGPTAAAETIKVPGDFDTIQEAVDAASTSDIVRVGKGTYAENVVVSTAGVTLQGKGAVIDGGYAGPCILVDGVDVVEITGFRLVNGTTGVSLFGNGGVVTKNVVEASAGAGIEIAGDDARISGNRLVACVVPMTVTASSASHTTVDGNRAEMPLTSSTLVGGAFDVVKNRVRGGRGGAFSITTSHAEEPSTVSGNRMELLDGTALVVAGAGDAATLVEKNRIDFVGENGLQISGSGVTASSNRILRAEDTSLLALTSGVVLTGNVVQQGGGLGIDLNDGSGPRIENNRVETRGDGLRMFADDAMVLDNRFTGNGQDGIDLVTGSDNVLMGNVCSKNGHEGIDNSGTNTTIVGNTALGNARGVGPDIAGSGNGGVGTVAPFEGTFQSINTFKTGGQTIPARLDID